MKTVLQIAKATARIMRHSTLGHNEIIHYDKLLNPASEEYFGTPRDC